MNRSQMFHNIVSLVLEGAITLEDLNDFSDDLKEAVKLYI